MTTSLEQPIYVSNELCHKRAPCFAPMYVNTAFLATFSDRARKPPLAEPSATGQALNPGDRVDGLGDFGKPTGEFGTVEQANEDDAVVKWDDDGRMRLHQPWLKKV